MKMLLTLAMSSLLICTGMTAANAQDLIKINGAGASFPYPIYAKWISLFNKQSDQYRLNYQSIGSGGGIRQFTQQTVDFGATDAPMKDKTMKKLDREIYHIPTVLGAVAVAYNLDLDGDLKMDGKTLANIFMGKIQKWNHPSLKKLNPDLNLPDKMIMPVRRADGSGTTAVFSDYLSKVSPEWKKKMGSGKALSWPSQIYGAKGNEGVTGMLKQAKGTIGYIELAYAKKNDLPTVALKNKNGKFVKPSTQAISAAAAGLKDDKYQGDLRLSITNAEGEKAYPISAFTFILIPQKPHTKQDKGVRKFLQWALNEGQQYAEELHYAPLPKKLIKVLEKRVQ